MNQAKREEIKARIAEGEARNEARAVVPLDPEAGADENGFVAFAREHPLVTVAGGLALGVLVAGMFPSARSAARKGGARASALGAAGTHAALAAFQHLLEAAGEAGRAGGEKLEDLGDSLGDTMRDAGRGARHFADRTSDGARIAARDTGKAVSRSLHRLWS